MKQPIFKIRLTLEVKISVESIDGLSPSTPSATKLSPAPAPDTQMNNRTGK